MGLYDAKGIEELRHKLEGFIDSFEAKTGQSFNPDDLRNILKDIYNNKIQNHMKAAFDTETMPTLKLLQERYDELVKELFPNEMDNSVEKSAHMDQTTNINDVFGTPILKTDLPEKKKRGRKAKA